MHFPDELVEQTKALFPQANHLHEAMENQDAIVVLGYLKQLSVPITDITNEWFVLAMKTEVELEVKAG